MLEKIGLFDEDFFCYLEDVDLAWRGQMHGWQALYVPQAQVFHHHSATGKEGSPFKNRQLGRNKIWLIVKNYPLPYLLFYFPVILVMDLAAVGYAVITRREWSALQGRIEALFGLFRMVRKRQSTGSEKELWRQLESVESPSRVLQRYRHIRA
jgi:GT2 family glycosyltransferase